MDVLTVEFKVNLLFPSKRETTVARGEIKRVGKTLTVCSACAFAISDGNEKVVATMLATVMTLAHAGSDQETSVK